MSSSKSTIFVTRRHLSLRTHFIVPNHRNQTKIKLKSKRILARQKQTVENLFSPTSPLAPQSESKRVWVDSNFLRRFLSREDGMEDLFRSASESQIILKSQSFLCEHSQGLHPRVARQGWLNRKCS